MSKRDLFVVVPDLDAENVVKTLLTSRQKSLGISVDFIPESAAHRDLLRYSGRDAGCLLNAVDLLRTPRKTHAHAMILFDHHGSGLEQASPSDIEQRIENDLPKSGWGKDDVAVIVLEPELETWVWANSVEVANHLGWKNDMPGLREHLRKKSFWMDNQLKPHNPKEAMQEALRMKKVPQSARHFSRLAEHVSMKMCQDRSFNKFRNTLRRWFSPQYMQNS